jgi:hypothetical protein
MGEQAYGTLSGTLPNGGNFYTPRSNLDLATALVTNASSSVTLTAAHALLVAVSTSLAAATTGSSGAGSMDRAIKTTLSASYATAVTAGV